MSGPLINISVDPNQLWVNPNAMAACAVWCCRAATRNQSEVRLEIFSGLIAMFGKARLAGYSRQRRKDVT